MIVGERGQALGMNTPQRRGSTVAGQKEARIARVRTYRHEAGDTGVAQVTFVPEGAIINSNELSMAGGASR